MRLISTTQDSYLFPPSYISSGANARPLEVVSPRISQISTIDASKGGIAKRADSYKAIYAENPLAIVSIKLIDVATGLEVPSLLRNIQLSTSISTFDTYKAGPDGTSEDTFVQDSQIFATLGRLSFDLRKYITSQVKLTAINRSGISLSMVVRIEVFSIDDSRHLIQLSKDAIQPKEIGASKAKRINLRNRNAYSRK